MEDDSPPPNPLSKSSGDNNNNSSNIISNNNKPPRHYYGHGITIGMADEGGGGGHRPSSSSRPFSVCGIYRRKHTMRAVFRGASLILLVGGYALYNHFGGGAGALNGGETSAQQRLRTNPAMANLENSGEGGIDFSRILGEDTDSNIFEQETSALTNPDSNATPAAAETAAECPELVVAEPTWLAALYAVGVLYLFLALAIVCDEFFVPALEEISSEHHMNLSMDVAGATLMAAGGSAPELFTSFVGTFAESDIGIGTIVGSAVFNVLFVIGMCSILSREVLTLTWWPLFRDSAYYAVGLTVLAVLAGVISQGKVYWWESCILLGMYVGYVILMYYNRRIYTALTGKILVLAGEDPPEAEGGGVENGTSANGGAATETTAAGSNGSSPLEAKARVRGENGESLHSSDNFLESNHGHVEQRQNTSPPNSPSMRHKDFRWPGTFRAGVLKLLLHPQSWEDKGGIGIVAKLQGDVDHVFKQIDVNGDGTIDREELGMLFEKLGHEISQEELGQVFSNLDLDGDGTICEQEFSKWYVKSEERILSKVKPIFDTFDTDKSGTIERNEVKELLRTLEPSVTETDVDDAIAAMYRSGSTEEITYEEFADWYVHSMIYTRQQTQIEKQIEEEAHGVCEALSPPRGEGCFAWVKYLLVLPLVAVLTLTIPDVRRPGYGKWCYLSFVLSIGWIGFFSYFMVNMTEIIGNTIGIPSVVMGYTVLAAGTSVPDLLSSVIVARMGEGDMAVSSSIGSNIFDILVGLPLPWLVFTLVPSTPDVVTIQAKGIFQAIFVLIGMLVVIIGIVHCQGWKMTKTLGGLMFVLYFAFLVYAIWTEYNQNPCFG